MSTQTDIARTHSVHLTSARECIRAAAQDHAAAESYLEDAGILIGRALKAARALPDDEQSAVLKEAGELLDAMGRFDGRRAA